MIIVKKNSYTSAQLLAWIANTKKTILPAPVAGSVNVVLGVSSVYTYNTVAYNNPSFFYEMAPGITQYNQNYMNVRMDLVINANGVNAGKINLPQTLTDEMIMFPDATPILGDGTLDIYVIYEVKLPV